MTVGEVAANEGADVAHQRDDMVENLVAAASQQVFRGPLARCLSTRALRSEARCLQEDNHIGIEFRVVVQDAIMIRIGLGKRSRGCWNTQSAVE